MKNNKMKWPLLALCLVVWGAVFYVLFGDKEEEIISRPKMDLSIVEKPIAENFDLALNYTDPFLNQNVKRKKTSTPIPSSTTSRDVPKNILDIRMDKAKDDKPKKRVVFPIIEYMGYVKQQSGGSGSSVLVMVDGKKYNWDKGKKIDDLYLGNIYLDSIRVSLDNEWKTITRK
ncbi:MAG: hypothetical protein ACPG5P_05970 [Saprospiraceae bacterium]